MRTIQTIALLGVALTSLSVVTLLMSLRSDPVSFWELVPALLAVSGQLLILWRLWHLRRWAGILTMIMAVHLAVYCLIWLPNSLPFLSVFLYMLWQIPRNWRHLKTGF